MLKKTPLFLLVLLYSHISIAQTTVHAVAETTPVSTWNAADDPAIWLHPTMPDSSFFLGTDKSTNGKIELYNLDGSRFWTTPEASRSYNNVDVMYGFVLGTDTVDLVSACNRTVGVNNFEFYKVDPDTRTLVNITGNTASGINNLYGYTTYHDLCSDRYYAFVTVRDGTGYCYQYEFYDNGAGKIDSKLVRWFSNLPTRTEGMVCDPSLGYFYISEESKGIWRYDADPDSGLDRVLMDEVKGPHLTALIEGLCIYSATDSTGYLIASSQGASNFQVYDRQSNNYLGTFSITTNITSTDTIDGCQNTDGIDVISYPLGSTYPHGAFIAHDLNNSPDFHNYKIVPWESIADSLGLLMSPFNPREYTTSRCRNKSDSLNTGIQEQATKTLRLYPNPSSELIHIQYNDNNSASLITIYNHIGQELRRYPNHPTSIDISNLAPGIYYLRSEDEVQSFIKQ